MMFEICRFPGSIFSTEHSTMGLSSTRSASSNTPTVSSDMQVDNFLHAIDKSHANAVAPSRAPDALNSSEEPQVASAHDGIKHEEGAKNLPPCSKGL